MARYLCLRSKTLLSSDPHNTRSSAVIIHADRHDLGVAVLTRCRELASTLCGVRVQVDLSLLYQPRTRVCRLKLRGVYAYQYLTALIDRRRVGIRAICDSSLTGLACTPRGPTIQAGRGRVAGGLGLHGDLRRAGRDAVSGVRGLGYSEEILLVGTIQGTVYALRSARP